MDPDRELVLCFDGTGNTFRADGGESNILKIFRMLDRTKENRYCYYQRTDADVSPSTLANLAMRPSQNLSTKKTLDLALATSFNKHVIGGYRFLARRWKPGCKIYLFGFSRGAYTARFLNEMLDYVGLISADNEELIPFVWEAFTDWKFAPQPHARRQEAYDKLRFSRETMCRPIERVQFLGLFDTVNSVAQFACEDTHHHSCQPRPAITRHAVSIDERRIKFQPVLFADDSGTKRRRPIRYDQPEEVFSAADSDTEDDAPPDLEEVYFAGDHSDIGGGWKPADGEEYPRSHVSLMWMVNEALLAGLTFDDDQVHPLFVDVPSSSSSSSSSSPASTTTSKHSHARGGGRPPHSEESPPTPNEASLSKAELAQTHDSLDYDSGKGFSTFFWRLLEYLPFRRRLVQPDGTIVVSRWHRCGQRRPLPPRALIHGSAVRKLRQDAEYRPYNLGMGVRPQAQKFKAQDRNIGAWEQRSADGVREYWVRV